jgi:hypothetical protein
VVGKLGGGRRGVLAQVRDPAGEAHERCAKLVRRLTGHCHPQPVARGREPPTEGPQREPRETDQYGALEQGEHGEASRDGQGTIVQRSHSRLHDRPVDGVQPGDPPRRIRQGPGRHVVRCCDTACGVSESDRDLEGPHLLGEIEQGVYARVAAGVAQPGEDPTEQPTGPLGVFAQVAGHDPGLPE